MANVIVDKNKIDLLANAISAKSGEPLTLTLDEMVEAVDGIETGGGVTPTGTITITTNGTTDVTNYAIADVQVPGSAPTLQTKTKTYTPTESQQTEAVTFDSASYDGLDTVNVTVNAISSTYVGTGITRRSSSDLTASGATVSVPSGYYENNASKVVASGGTLAVKTATITKTATGQTVSFSSLSGEPKYWFLRITSQLSSSGSTTYYYITDLFYDGTNIKGNSFRIGSTRRIYNITSGISQSYSDGTLTITGGSSPTATPGQFYGASNFGYELVYIY